MGYPPGGMNRDDNLVFGGKMVNNNTIHSDVILMVVSDDMIWYDMILYEMIYSH